MENIEEETESLPEPPPEIASILEFADEWNFDLFALADASNNKPLKYLGPHLFNKYGILQEYKINPVTLDKFLTRIDEGYCRQPNPYHNNLHGADIFQTVHYMILKTGLVKWLDNLETLSCLLGGMLHDFDHTGKTNNFLIATKSDYALIYNDRSVQENHHISASFFVLRDKECNILSNLSNEQFHELRNLIIDMILSTDMSYHFHLLKSIKVRLDSPEMGTERHKVLGILLHTADLSHPGKSWHLHYKWTMRLLEEFFAQGDEERELGLPISPLCDRYTTLVPESQIHFIDFIAEPCLSTFAGTIENVLQPIADQCKEANAEEGSSTEVTKFRIRKPWIPNLKENKKKWKEVHVKVIPDPLVLADEVLEKSRVSS